MEIAICSGALGNILEKGLHERSRTVITVLLLSCIFDIRALSGTKKMLADPFDYRTGTNPFVAGFIRIIIVDRSAARIPAV